MMRQNTLDIPTRRPPEPKATGSNPVSRVPPNIHTGSVSLGISGEAAPRTVPPGTPAGQTVSLRRAALGDVGPRRLRGPPFPEWVRALLRVPISDFDPYMRAAMAEWLLSRTAREDGG